MRNPFHSADSSASSSSRPSLQEQSILLETIPEGIEHNNHNNVSDEELGPHYARVYRRQPRWSVLSFLDGPWRLIVESDRVSWSKKSIFITTFKRSLAAFIFFLGCVKFLSLLWAGLVCLFPDDLDDRLDGWSPPGGSQSIFSHWDTQGVATVQCHSHNDYWRDVPLLSAITAGCTGVEADIWLSDEELLVGHNVFTLHHEQNLRSLYLDPLLRILQHHNTRSSRLQGASAVPAGIFATDPLQTLVLLVDFKTTGATTWPYVVDQLGPLHEAGYLTYWDGADVNIRPVTVVATGDAPFDLIQANQTYRYIFYDAPLDQLDLEEAPGNINYNYTNSYYASVDFRTTIGGLSRNRFSPEQLDLLRQQIEAAHARGLKVRYWGTPTWPRGLRNHVWWVLVREGVDLINADDLREATMQDWRKHRSWFS